MEIRCSEKGTFFFRRQLPVISEVLVIVHPVETRYIFTNQPNQNPVL